MFAPTNPAAQASPAGLGQAGGGYFAQMPVDQSAQPMQIRFAERRNPDLSKLKALFKAPILYRG